jgi:hypothetical protein
MVESRVGGGVTIEICAREYSSDSGKEQFACCLDAIVMLFSVFIASDKRVESGLKASISGNWHECFRSKLLEGTAQVRRAGGIKWSVHHIGGTGLL